MERSGLLGGVAIVACLSACAAPSTGAVPIGRDTYMLGKPGGVATFAGAEVKAELYREANEFCGRQEKQMLPLSANARDSGPFQYATAEITFRCLAASDAELQRPARVPDSVIETRAR